MLAEKRGRKTALNPHFAVKCDAILGSLGGYLTEHFPNATVVVKRGGDLYTDMARLALAKVTFCSVSTFCLWPAIASSGTVYFPRSKLIASGKPVVLGSILWVDDPKIVMGADHIRDTPRQMVTALSGKYEGAG